MTTRLAGGGQPATGAHAHATAMKRIASETDRVPRGFHDRVALDVRVGERRRSAGGASGALGVLLLGAAALLLLGRFLVLGRLFLQPQSQGCPSASPAHQHPSSSACTGRQESHYHTTNNMLMGMCHVHTHGVARMSCDWSIE